MHRKSFPVNSAFLHNRESFPTCKFLLYTVFTVGTENDVTEVTEGEGTPCKKPKLKLLEKLVGKQFDNVSVASGAAAISSSEIVQVEISHYKRIPVISLRDRPLQWWNLNKHDIILPNLSIIGTEILGNCGNICSLETFIQCCRQYCGSQKSCTSF